MISLRSKLLVSVASCAVCCMPAFAQQDSAGDLIEAAPSEGLSALDSSTGGGGPERIIVTAQRREQTLQEVPVSVAVVGGEFLREQHVVDAESLDSYVPSLSFTKSPFQPLVSIRGLGSGAGTRAFEQSVATYVDGIYAGRANQFLNPYFDVERVEVVRGPQTVLFGINAIAGAINVVNKKAGDEFEGYATAGYELENEGYNVEGGASIPLTDTLSLRLAGRADLQGPYLNNTFTGGEEPEVDSQIGRGILSWTPTPDFRADLSYEHARREVDGSGFQTTYLPIPGFFPGGFEDGNVDFNKSSTGSPDFTHLTSDNTSLNMSYDFAGHTLTSSTGYSEYDFSQALPAGAVPVFFGTALADEKYEQFYQEFRLESPSGGFFEYLAGATYYQQDSRINSGTEFDFTAFGSPGLTAAIRYGLDQDTDAYSAFGQATLNLNERLNVVAGLRYSSVEKHGVHVISPTTPGAPLSGYPFDVNSLFILNGAVGFFQYLDPMDPSTIRSSVYDRERTFTHTNPSLSVNYEINDNVSTYASYTTGTKAGGFNDQEQSGVAPENGFASDSFEYASEDARNYEIGAKLNYSDFRFNLAVFHSKYEDLQASQALANGSILTTNAASASAEGVEADATLFLTPELTLGGDLAYIHARYDNYPGSGCIISITPSACDPALENARDGRLDGVPDFTASANIAYMRRIGGSLELSARGRAYYNDGAQYQSNQDPLDRTPDYWLLDAMVSIAHVDSGWSLTLSGKNLADEAIRGFSAPAASPFFGHQSYTLPGRTIFLDARYDF